MSRVLRAVAASAVVALVVPASAAAASSTGGTPQVVNRETVQAELTSTGKLDVARLFSQLTVVGKGTVKLADPTSGKGLRNLDGFSAPDIKDGKALYTIHVDGTANRRTVSDFTKALPVTISAEYTFNGKSVKPADIVGKSGDLSVLYTVKNVSATPTDITWKDGLGATHKETVDLVTPYVGQLSTTLPSSFSNLTTPRADMAADGRGGTLLTWTMVLFEPIGQDTQTFGWSGHVTHAQIPAVGVQIVPVPPAKKPELKFGVDGFQQGAEQASQLTAGGGLIDANLLKLQDGASQLLDGLTKLSAGAVALRDGLTAQIGPGASKLAAGAKTAKAGSGALASGLGDLAAGAGKLSSGIGTAKAGSGALSSGLATASTGASDLAAGIGQILAGVQALPTSITSNAGYQQLVGSLAAVQAAIATQLVPGVDALRTGVSSVKTGLQTIEAGVGSGGATITALINQLVTDVIAAGGDATVLGDVSTLGSTLTAQSTALVSGLSAVIAGLGSTTDMTSATLQGGLNLLQGGLDNPACVLTNPTDPTNPCGIKQVQGLISAGIGQLVSGISAQLAAALTTAHTGAVALSSGMTQLAAGGAQLDSGLGQLASGGTQLAAGATDAKAGAGQLDSGLGAIATGAGDLSAGIDKAASGSKELAAGLDQAKGGDKQVVDGTSLLRSQGTSALVAGGNDTASVNAEHYARLVALGAKAQDGALPYGAPEGATGSAAYQFTLAAATSQGRDNVVRALLAVLLLIAASAVSWTVRRRFSR